MRPIEEPPERTLAAPESTADSERGLERRALEARDVHDALRAEGSSELERPWTALAWSGLAAGLSISLSMLAQGLLRAHLPDTPWRILVSSLGYTAGFVAVTLGRQQLYTETTLTACLPLLHEPSTGTFARVVRLWIVVLSANLLGTWLFAWVAVHESAFDPELRRAFLDLAREATSHDPWSAFVRGVIGGWIIALMVWLLPSAESARPWIIIMMTYLIAAGGLTHIIAGTAEAFYGIAAGEISISTYLWRYALPVLAGNSVGGIVFVALLNHAQVEAEQR